MSVFANFPKGIMVVNHKIEDVSKIKGDFLIAYMGAGMKRSNFFHDQVQAAADAKLPLMAFYENDPRVFLNQYETLNLAKWLENPEANYQIKECIGPQIMSGGMKRRIHGVIVSLNQINETATKMFPPVWIAKTAIFTARAIWRLYKLPVNFYMDAEQAAKISSAVDFREFLARLVRYDAARYPDAPVEEGEQDPHGEPGIMEGIGTYLDTFSSSAVGDWGDFPSPLDTAAPKLSDKVKTSGLGNAPRLSWWCYSAGDFTFPGVSGGTVLLFMYRGSKARLYEELGYEGESGGEQPPTVPEIPAGGGGSGDSDGDTVDDELKAIGAQLMEIQKDMAKVAESLIPLAQLARRILGG